MTQISSLESQRQPAATRGLSSPRLADMIFVSMENWDDVWRRNQFICAGLARRYPRMKILFVGLARDLSHGIRHADLGALGAAVSVVPECPNITVFRPLKLLPNTLRAGRRLNEVVARRQIARLAGSMGLTRPLLWLNPHTAVHMAGKLGESAVVYDITDDWISLTQREWLRALTAAQDRRLCERADAVIVCSERLHEMKLGQCRALHLVPNGVDADHYRRVRDTDAPLPAAMRDCPRPVLGYTGSIHPDRVDVALVVEVARAFPTGTVALVGPNMLRRPEIDSLMACGNVRLTGPSPYREVPDIMRAFDVCITPHRMTPFTESLNPIKLWEYLAGGKPIVSTDVAGFRDYPDLVRIARDAPSFVDAVNGALAEGNAKAARRQAEARKHSWDARLDLLEGILRGCSPPSWTFDTKKTLCSPGAEL